MSSIDIQPKTDAWFRALDQEMLDSVPLKPPCPTRCANVVETGRRIHCYGPRCRPVLEVRFQCPDCGALSGSTRPAEETDRQRVTEETMSDREIKNATIGSTALGAEDHGILTAWLHLDYGGSGQGFGGYAFDGPTKRGGGRRGSAFGCEYIRRVLDILGVATWEKLPGTPLRVMVEAGLVVGIGHYLKDRWFYPSRLADEMKTDSE